MNLEWKLDGEFWRAEVPDTHEYPDDGEEHGNVFEAKVAQWSKRNVLIQIGHKTRRDSIWSLSYEGNVDDAKLVAEDGLKKLIESWGTWVKLRAEDTANRQESQ